MWCDAVFLWLYMCTLSFIYCGLHIYVLIIFSFQIFIYLLYFNFYLFIYLFILNYTYVYNDSTAGVAGDFRPAHFAQFARCGWMGMNLVWMSLEWMWFLLPSPRYWRGDGRGSLPPIELFGVPTADASRRQRLQVRTHCWWGGHSCMNVWIGWMNVCKNVCTWAYGRECARCAVWSLSAVYVNEKECVPSAERELIDNDGVRWSRASPAVPPRPGVNWTERGFLVGMVIRLQHGTAHQVPQYPEVRASVGEVWSSGP